ncbi:hypothetical protein CSPAE12_07602 [Colletotrichum incanum]|nr:hypothetical protein CSPAE12_07602 [Colletotrichum incanum]
MSRGQAELSTSSKEQPSGQSPLWTTSRCFWISRGTATKAHYGTASRRMGTLAFRIRDRGDILAMIAPLASVLELR